MDSKQLNREGGSLRVSKLLIKQPTVSQHNGLHGNNYERVMANASIVPDTQHVPSLITAG